MPNRNKKNAPKAPQQVASTSAGPSKAQKKKNKNNNNNNSSRKNAVSGEGTITLSRRELLDSISLTASGSTFTHKSTIKVQPDSFPFLKGIASSFDRSKWLKCNFYYKPFIGANIGGVVTMAVDWDSTFTATDDRVKVCALTPCSSIAAWQDSEKNQLVLPRKQLQSRQWYIHNSADAKDLDKGPAIIAIAAKGSSVMDIGEIWCDYQIVMQGTRSA